MKNSNSKSDMSKIWSKCSISNITEMRATFYGIRRDVYKRYVDNIFEEASVQE